LLILNFILQFKYIIWFFFNSILIILIFLFVKVIFLFNLIFMIKISYHPLIYFLFWFSPLFFLMLFLVILYNWFFFMILSFNVWFVEDWPLRIFSSYGFEKLTRVNIFCFTYFLSWFQTLTLFFKKKLIFNGVSPAPWPQLWVSKVKACWFWFFLGPLMKMIYF
jgi:hypothetical protein